MISPYAILGASAAPPSSTNRWLGLAAVGGIALAAWWALRDTRLGASLRSHLPHLPSFGGGGNNEIDERGAIERALAREGTPRRAAPLLGVGYRTVNRRMREYGIPVAPRGRPRTTLKDVP